MFTVPVILIILAAVAGSTGMVGFAGWIMHRLSRLESMAPGELQRLLSENEALRDQVEALRSDMKKLDERVDFTERLLEGKKPESIGPGSDTR